MRVIRPNSLTITARRRAMLLALSMLAVGVLAVELAVVGATTETGAAVMGASAALALGVGTAWLLRVVRPVRGRRIGEAVVALLAPTLDDTYTLVVAPRLPVRDAVRLDAILVGPGGARVLTARDWEGRYRVRGRVWEFDARGRRGWVSCRTNPSIDAASLTNGVARWATEAGLPEITIRPTVVFPRGHSRIVLEEPAHEIVTSDNAPWWANTIGRVRRIDATTSARLIEAVLDAADQSASNAPAPVTNRTP